jgi:hypothetical protein
MVEVPHRVWSKRDDPAVAVETNREAIRFYVQDRVNLLEPFIIKELWEVLRSLEARSEHCAPGHCALIVPSATAYPDEGVVSG